LDAQAGPLGLTADGSAVVNRPANQPNPYSIIPQGAGGTHGNLWGIPVVVTTQIAAGTAIVASIASGAGIFWTRLGLWITFDPYAGPSGTNFVTNTFTYRAEERVALSVPRPTALNIVTGLPTS
jgi:hypothetical protein